MNTTYAKVQSMIGFYFPILIFLFFLTPKVGLNQSFPNPASLSTGQGAPGSIDPLWLASPWYASNPPNPMGLPYISTLINNNCAPGAWVDPASLPAPVNNGNWITGSDDDCETNTNSGFRYFRLPLNLPADCNGFSVTVAGNYVLNLIGYSDNTIADVFVNGTSTGINGGNFAAGGQLEIELVGPWQVGLNYVDVLVHNFQGANPGDANPYGLLLVADATQDSQLDTDNDGISNLDDVCPCEAGTNPFGCNDPTLYNCDMDAIRQAFTDAGCIEMPGCSSDCSVYFLNPQQMTGSQAQTFAQNLGANLVSIQSQDENDCILSSLGNLGQTGVIWIGFSDEVSEGNFVWYDQSSIVYTNWAPGEPNQSGDEDCVQIYPTGASPGTWNDLSCNSANSRSIIEVNLCPIIDAGSPISLCIGESTTLTASNTLFGSAPYTYSWDTGENAQTTTVSPTISSEYTVTTVDRYGCTNSDSVDVTINLLPTVNGGNDVTVCPQQNATLSGSGALSYTWNNDVINNTPFIPYLSNAEYIVTGTDANGCQNTDTVNVFVQLNGCANFPNDFTCDIDSIRSAFAAAGCTEMISCVSPCSMYFLNEQSMSGSQAQAFTQTLGANLVSIQSQEENECIVSSLVNLGLNSINDVIWIGFNDEVQEGTFGWYDQSTVSFTNWNTGEPNDAGGNEDCTQIYPDGFWNDLPCNSSNARSVIEVNLCPVINAGSDQLICLNDAATLQASSTLNGSYPYTYTWNDGTIGQANTVSPSNATNYSISTVDRYGCTDSDTVLVTVAPLPTADFTFVQACFEEPVIFTNTSSIVAPETITSVTWNFGDGSVPVSSTNTQHIFTNPGTYSVNLTVISANGCSDSQTQTLIVNPVPTGTQNESICEGESFVFGGNTYSIPGSYAATFQNAAGCDSIVTLVLAQFSTPEDPIITSNSPLECPDDQLILSINSVNGASYTWSGPNGFSSTEQTITFPAGLSDVGVYTAIISINDCPSEPSSTSVLILGKNELSIADFPNVITPNGDGINDVYVLNTAFTSCLPYQLSVFNRWGNLVYEQTFETAPFAGLDQAGTKLAAGVYFYKLTYGEFEKSGFISVIQD